MVSAGSCDEEEPAVGSFVVKGSCLVVGGREEASGREAHEGVVLMVENSLLFGLTKIVTVLPFLTPHQ